MSLINSLSHCATKKGNKMNLLKKSDLSQLLLASVLTTCLTSASTWGDIMEAEDALNYLIQGPKKEGCQCDPAERPLSNWSISGLEKTVLKRLGDDNEVYYDVQFGDTLDSIIKSQLSEFPVKKSIVREAIVSANRHAFRRNNPHWMYANKKLKLPDNGDIHQAIFKTAAPEEGNASNRRHKDWIRYP